MRSFTHPLALLVAILGGLSLVPASAQPAADPVAVLRSDATEFEKVQACRRLAVVDAADAVPVLEGFLDDPHLAVDARGALEKIPHPEAGRALVRALSVLEGDPLCGVINSLGARREAAAVPVLADLVNDPEDDVAGAALAALGRIATHGATPVLLRGLRADRPALCDEAASACLAAGDWYLREGHTRRARGLFASVREAPCVSDRLRLAATCREIACLGPGATGLLRSLLRSRDSDKMQAGLRLVRDMPDEGASRILGEALRGAAGVRRERILQALAERDDAVARQALDRATLRFVPLFDGKTFDGWEGDTASSFRIEGGAIVGGNLVTPIPRNEFLCTTRRYANFVLRLQCKVVDANGGVQFRTERVPDSREVAGYQADMDASGAYWGCLYDESRRGMLVQPPPEVVAHAARLNDWNDYEIRCEGSRIRLFLNGVLTVDYTERDAKIPNTGLIGVQVHAGPPSETWYRSIRIAELP